MELKEFHAIARDDGLFDVTVKYNGEFQNLKHKSEPVTKVEDEINLKGVYLADICTYIPNEDENIIPLYFITKHLDICNKKINE